MLAASFASTSCNTPGCFTPLVNDLLTFVGDPAKPIFAGSISISSNVQVSIGLSNTSTIAPTFIYLGWLASASTVTNPGVGSSNNNQAVAVGVGYAPTDRFRVNTKFSTSSTSKRASAISIGASVDLDW